MKVKVQKRHLWLGGPRVFAEVDTNLILEGGKEGGNRKRQSREERQREEGGKRRDGERKGGAGRKKN